MKPKPVKKTEGKPKKDKSQAKRLKTFSSSQFSLWQQKNKVLQGSATDLTHVKNEALSNRRAINSSALSQYSNVKANTMKVPAKKKKKVGTKTKGKTKQIQTQEQFEKARYKQSNSQSQIVFSNDGTKRQSGVSLKDVKYINSVHCSEIDSNLVLRVNIKKQYVRKVQAATKIQKVFRGFMTRKILMKYVQDQEERLKNKINGNSSSEFDQIRQNQTHRTFIDKQGQNLMSRLFENKAIADINFNHTIRPRVEDFSDQSSSNENSGKKKISGRNKKIQKRQQINFNQINGKSWMQCEDKEQEEGQEVQEQKFNQQQQSSSNDESNMIYKRQDPIYSQEQISQYLESSQEEQDQQLDEYEPEIIFQTNQQYIESRKSSLQNKNQTKNKLSNKGITDVALLLANEQKIRKQLLNQNDSKEQSIRKSLKGESKPQQNNKQVNKPQIQSKEVTEKYETKQTQNNEQEKLKKQVTEEVQKVKQSKNQNSSKTQNQNEADILQNFEIRDDSESTKKKKRTQMKVATQKIKESLFLEQKKQKSSRQYVNVVSPRRQVKYLDQEQDFSNQSLSGSRSHLSVERKQIIRLKEQECEKWDQVIKMVSQQIRKQSQSSAEIVSFMKNIMQFSQKNKDILASTRSVNSQSESFTTPTSFDVQCSAKVKQQSKSVGLPINQPDEQNKQSDVALKFFKKKKPLKIDIVDSNFLREQKQTINAEIPEKKFVKSNFGFDSFKDNKKELINELKQQRLEIVPYCARDNTKQDCMKDKVEIEESFQKSKTLKKFLASNIQVQDEAITDILKLREQLLQKRQSQELVKLNQQLRSNQLTQQSFLDRLSNLTKKFTQQKQIIDKAKQDIIKGYQAANNLVKEYFFDIRRMGIKLAVSKSQDNLKYKFSQPPLFSCDVKIDELTPKSTPKSSKRVPIKQIFAEHQISEQKGRAIMPHQNSIESSEDSSIDFTEEQLKRFRKAANYDLEFNDLNRNMTTLSDDFIKQQRKCYLDESEGPVTSFCESPENIRQNRIIIPQKQTYMLDEIRAPSARTPPHVQSIVDSQINMLIWELSCELLLKPQISEKIMEKPSMIRPSSVTTQQRLEFLKTLQQNLPGHENLIRKLNQNITPLPSQILKCMRLDFSEQPEEEEQDDNYQQINRYEFVISQEACAKSVMLFKNSIDQIEQRKQIQQMKKNNDLLQEFQLNVGKSSISEKIQRFIHQREKFLKNKKQHTRELRWEVINIELHCIFDSWNEQIIQICSSRSGFSGIGLNELTLSMINHNRRVPEERCLPIVKEAQQKVVEILTDDTDINAKILKQNFHEMCETDSAWIFYADEALSYALELVYLVEEDIYTEFSKEIRKIMVKSSLMP